MNLRALEKLRDKIYRRTKSRRVRTLNDAAHFIDGVGFCLLFASAQGIELPSLFEAVKGKRDAHIQDWDADSDRVWVWKNDLPAAHRAYYGKALAGGKPVFISRKLLPHFFALAAPESIAQEYARGRVSTEARRVYDALRANGPMPTMALRAATALDAKRYHHALDELQRAMVILPAGAILERGAWLSQIFALTAKWFPNEFERAQKIPAAAARATIVQQYLATVRAANVQTIARVVGWKRDELRQTVDALIARRVVVEKDGWLTK